MSIDPTSAESVDRVFSLLNRSLPQLSALELPVGGDEVDEATKPEVFFAAFELGNNVAVFKEDDVKYIKDLFGKYKIGNHFCLFDLFSIHFFSLLKYYKEILGDSEVPTGEWVGSYLMLEEGILRTNSMQAWKENITTQFFQKPFLSLIKLRKLTNQLTEKVKGFKNLESRISIPEDKKMGKTAQKKYKQKKVEELKQTSADWEEGLKVLNKIVLHPQNYSILFGKILSSLPGSCAMTPDSLEDLPKVFQVLEAHLEAFTQGFKNLKSLGGFRNEAIAKELNKIQVRIRDLQKLEDPSDKVCQIRALMEKLTHCVFVTRDFSMQFFKDSRRSQGGSLTHKQWCEERGITPVRYKEEEEFKEFLLLTSAELDIQSYIFTDCKTVFELVVLPLLDPDFASSFAHLERAKEVGNLLKARRALYFDKNGITLLMQQTGGLADSVTELISGLAVNGTNDVIRKLEGIFYQNLGSLKIKIKKDNETVDNETVFDYWMGWGYKDTYGAANMNQPAFHILYDFLENESERYLQFLNTGCKSLESLEWENVEWLAQLFVLVHDLGIVLGKKDPGSSDSEIFPEAFLEWVELDEEERNKQEVFIDLEDSLDSSSSIENEIPISKSEKKEDPIAERGSSEEELEISIASSTSFSSWEANSPSSEKGKEEEIVQEKESFENGESIIYPIASLSSSSSSPQTEEKQELSSLKSRRMRKQEKKQERALRFTKIETKQEKEERAPVNPQIFGADPRDLLESRKLNHVKRTLERMGLEYIRSKGDHAIYVHPQDPRSHATVPEHGEIAIGTLRSIYKQAIGEQTGGI